MEVRFQLMNRQFVEDYQELNSLFGWPQDAPTSAMLEENQYDEDELVDESAFDVQDVWRTLTNDVVFSGRRSKSSHIIHPAVRYIHRLLVYSIWGRGDLGAMSNCEMKCLWLMPNPLIDDDKPFPINYAEQFITRMVDYRDGSSHTKDICMGGMVTLIAFKRVNNFSLTLVDKISDNYSLDERMLVDNFRWLTRLEGDRFKYHVGVGKNVMAPWIDLPNPPVTRLTNQRRRDPFHIPRTYAPTAEELHATAAAAAVPPPPPRAPRQAQPQRGHETSSQEQGESSMSFDFSSVHAELAAMRAMIEQSKQRRQRDMDHQLVYLRGLYGAQVEAGNI